MMMGIDETRADDFVGAVDYFGSIAFFELSSNVYDDSVLDQDIHLGRDNVILGVVYEHYTVLEQKGCSRCVWHFVLVL